MGCVYLATNRINGKCYVGQTVRTMEHRRRGHEKEALAGSRGVFHCALRKYGFDVFDWGMLFRGRESSALYEAEQSYIKSLKTKSPNGYNLADGGFRNKGWKLSAKGVSQNRERAIKQFASPEARKKHSESVKRSKAHQEAMRSSEYRVRQSEGTKDRWKEPGYGKRMIRSMFGRKRKPSSVETRKKMSLAHIGKPHTSERRTKNSESRKKWWSIPENRTMMLAARKAGKSQRGEENGH